MRSGLIRRTTPTGPTEGERFDHQPPIILSFLLCLVPLFPRFLEPSLSCRCTWYDTSTINSTTVRSNFMIPGTLLLGCTFLRRWLSNACIMSRGNDCALQVCTLFVRRIYAYEVPGTSIRVVGIYELPKGTHTPLFRQAIDDFSFGATNFSSNSSVRDTYIRPLVVLRKRALLAWHAGLIFTGK